MKRTPELVERAKEMQDDGLSLNKIAIRFGVSWSTLKRWLDPTTVEKSVETAKSAYFREYYLKNKKAVLNKQKEYIQRNRSKTALYQKEYRQNHKEEHNKYKRDIRAASPQHKIAYNLRCRINKVFDKGQKAGSSVSDLGCTLSELVAQFESLFQPGMTWENHGEWHIDHVRPLASFDLTDREQFLQDCHHTNLQPLWAEDNLRKGNKYERVA